MVSIQFIVVNFEVYYFFMQGKMRSFLQSHFSFVKLNENAGRLYICHSY